MVASKLLLGSIAIALVIYGVGANSGIEELRSRISALESSISDRIQDIKKKDQSFLNLENVIKEKSASIFSLLSEIELLQKQAAADEQAVEKAHKQAFEMDKKVTRLKSEIEAQTMKRGALEARGDEAGKKIQELNLKLESLQKTYNEQTLSIRSIERALQVAEVHEAWILPRLALHMSHFQKWIPAANEQMVIFTSNVQPYAQLMSAKSMEVYDTYKKIITPHIMKAKELTDPYYQEARKFSMPYIGQIANVSKPHVEKLQVLLDPCHKLAVHSYKKFAKATVSYHNQVKVIVHENLKKHELTKPLATWELSWFLASALLAIPMFCFFRLLLAIFCMRTTGGLNGNRNQVPNNHKRKHGDK